MYGWLDGQMDGCTQCTRAYIYKFRCAQKCTEKLFVEYCISVWTMSLSDPSHNFFFVVQNAKGSYPTKNIQCMQLFALAFCLPKLRIAGKNKHANKFFMAAVCIQNNFHFNSFFFMNSCFVCLIFVLVSLLFENFVTKDIKNKNF